MLKAELHCHMEGAAETALVERLARKYDVDLGNIIKDGVYCWHDFSSFLNAYDIAASVFRSREDYRLLAYDHYSRLAAQDCIYAEVIASPDHAAVQGLGFTDMIEGIVDGIDDARREFGIEGRIQITCVRHLGPDSAEAVAHMAADNPHPMITGFGMAGDERQFEVEDFAEAFAIAEEAGLGLTAHAGELCGAQSVQNCIDHLGVNRIGHGVRAAESPEVINALLEAGIVLEVCPGSNLALSIFPSAKEHPLRQLHEAGIPVTLNSDDPPFFHTSLANEYHLTKQEFGFDDETLLAITRQAVQAAFVDDATRQRLLKRLTESS